MWIADAGGERRQCGYRALDTLVGGDIGVRRSRLYRHLAAGSGYSRIVEAAEINDVGRGGEPLLHRRQERHAARQELAVLRLIHQLYGVRGFCRPVIVEVFHMSPPYSAAILPECSAFHTVCGVAGMGRSLTPKASVMAFITAAGPAMAPASPQPFMPIGLDGHLVSVKPSLNDATSVARGMQ